MTKTPTDITLYTAQTPNGIKVSILLEELGLDYKVHQIKMMENEQKQDWFLEINPNGRIPAIKDGNLRVFESGAVLQYLVDKYDKDHKVSYPHGTDEYYEMTSWLHWQMGGLGPMQGQSNHFKRYAPEKIQYGIDRYGNETRRLYKTMDTQLAKTKYLAGDKVTIADIACWGWVAGAKWAGVDLGEFPKLEKWVYDLLARPGFEAGRHVPAPHTAFDSAKLTEEEINAKAAEARNWVQAGMKSDAQK
ncbi:hypothetical protein N3K66_007996 [Trichothecium roseum]|uniref:Uncharacterized protein n=1 Tax=Trichothecium roseum TaxID=47278 RepID=A0ACC0US57_9HYPO|nr:hypothetical protein N3K66_007996 [Trichothecium roseum]